MRDAIRHTPGHPKATAAPFAARRGGVTLIELLVLMALFALVFSILVPAMSGGHNQAMATKCQANLREIGVCTTMYIQAQDGRRLIPWYQYPVLQGNWPSISGISPSVFGGFKAPNPVEDSINWDYEHYPADIRPLNKIAYPEARGANTIDLYICPSDRSRSTVIIGGGWPENEGFRSSWEATGTSYPLNTRFMQGYSLPSGNWFAEGLEEYTARIAEHMLGGEASSFIMWVEQGFFGATGRAGPTIEGIAGGALPRRQGWHGKFSAWSVGFADGHVGYGYFDTRQIYGLGGTIWQPNFDHGL